MDISLLSDSQKLDFLVTSVVALQQGQNKLEQLVTRVQALETTVATQASIITSLQQEVKYLKERDNLREQQSRCSVLRLFNFPGSDSETNLAGKVYDKLLKPILAAAKSKGDISTLPQLGTTVEEAFRAGRFAAGSNKPPPPVIIRFTSPAIRLAVLKNKRNNTPPSPDGAKRMILVEDLTPATHRKMKELQADERVAKVWTMSGTLMLVKTSDGENAKAKPVRSIFESNDTILA